MFIVFSSLLSGLLLFILFRFLLLLLFRFLLLLFFPQLLFFLFLLLLLALLVTRRGLIPVVSAATTIVTTTTPVSSSIIPILPLVRRRFVITFVASRLFWRRSSGLGRSFAVILLLAAFMFANSWDWGRGVGQGYLFRPRWDCVTEEALLVG